MAFAVCCFDVFVVVAGGGVLGVVHGVLLLFVAVVGGVVVVAAVVVLDSAKSQPAAEAHTGLARQGFLSPVVVVVRALNVLVLWLRVVQPRPQPRVEFQPL